MDARVFFVEFFDDAQHRPPIGAGESIPEAEFNDAPSPDGSRTIATRQTQCDGRQPDRENAAPWRPWVISIGCRALLRCLLICRRVHFALFRHGNYDLRPALFGPVDVEEISARLVGAFVGVGAEVIALALQQVGRQACRAVAVVVGQGAT